MINHGMEYNSQKEDLVIAEYGRNVQNLINYAKSIEDKEKRQFYAEAIVNLMHLMNPAERNDADYLEKLWRHLFRISKYEIDVVPQSGVIPTQESSEYHPSIIEYPENLRDYRHYGYHVKLLIQKASEVTDDEKRYEFSMVIASYMKMAYRTWSKDHYVNDEIIKGDLKAMSKGKLFLNDDEDINVSNVPNVPQRPARKVGSSNSNKSRKNFQRNNNSANNKGPRRRR
jgi:hypothetical protein